jgi:phosphoserine phosphatase
VASCGTADLSERILEASGLRRCFEAVLGNRFVFTRGAITGMEIDLPTPEAKLQAIRSAGLDRGSTVAVGDGPTDIPLLKWAGIPVVVAPRGPGRVRWAPKSCSIIASVSELLDILKRLGG